MKNRLIALFLFLTLSTVFISGCGKEKEAEEQKAKKQVKIQEIKLQNKVTSTLTASGTVIPKQYSVIRSLTQGTVEYITPVGTNVVIGQALFQIRDNSIENNYFNALQNHRQTSVISDERVTQAELALNSAQARLNLAEKNLETTKKQTAQGLTNVKESTIITYNSAYNALNQVFNFVSDGSANNIDFRYLNITTRNTQLHIDTKTQYLTAASIFIDLEKIPNRADLNQSLNEIYNVVSATKLLTDLNVLLLQNTIGGLKSIDSDKLIITNYQAQVNGYIDAIVASQNALRNTKINNQLMIDQTQNQLELSQIDFDNSGISLANAKNGAELEKTIAQNRLDNASYNYSNLAIVSPFSGTIMSSFIEAGQQVSLGQEVIELGNLSIVEVAIDIDSEFSKNLKIGDKVQINDLYEGFISEVEPSGNIQSGKVGIKIQAQNPDEFLVAGDIADISFELVYSQKDLIIIPIKSATIESTGTYVYVLEDGKSIKKSITLGKIFGDKVSVENGLQPGDKMILKNGVFISEGEEVEIKQ